MDLFEELMTTKLSRPLAVTTGDPNGIGIEITAKAWENRQADNIPPFFLIGDPEIISDCCTRQNIHVHRQEIVDVRDVQTVFNEALPILPLTGITTPANQTVNSIRLGVELCLDGQASALVTNPIQKKRLYDAGFEHPGHTEYLASLTGRDGRAVMMLACSELKVIPATIHIPLKEVPKTLTRSHLELVILTTHQDLKARFAIPSPRIAVAGLNPHAGEGGSIGEEEASIIKPVIQKLQGQGMDITGPFPADSMFHKSARQKFDAAICMYHDQALIPLKTIDFDGGVNVTLGLPIIRTSPDHGTAEDIVGQNIANPASLIAALKMAAEMVAAENG